MQSCSHPREDNPGYCDSPEQITPNKTCTLTHTRMCTHTQICAHRCTRSQGPRQTYWGGDVGCGGEPWPQLRHHYLMATLPTRPPARARARTHFGTRYVAGTRTHTHTQPENRKWIIHWDVVVSARMVQRAGPYVGVSEGKWSCGSHFWS